MSILFLAAAALAAPTPTHTVAYEQGGKTYSIAYIAHVDTTSHLDGVRPAGRRAPQRCLTEGDVTIERRITESTSGQSMSTMLPGSATISQTHAGRCGNFAARSNDLVVAQAETIQAQLIEMADADKPRVAATINAARSLAAR